MNRNKFLVTLFICCIMISFEIFLWARFSFRCEVFVLYACCRATIDPPNSLLSLFPFSLSHIILLYYTKKYETPACKRPPKWAQVCHSLGLSWHTWAHFGALKAGVSHIIIFVCNKIIRARARERRIWRDNCSSTTYAKKKH